MDMYSQWHCFSLSFFLHLDTALGSIGSTMLFFRQLYDESGCISFLSACVIPCSTPRCPSPLAWRCCSSPPRATTTSPRHSCDLRIAARAAAAVVFGTTACTLRTCASSVSLEAQEENDNGCKLNGFGAGRGQAQQQGAPLVSGSFSLFLLWHRLVRSCTQKELPAPQYAKHE